MDDLDSALAHGLLDVGACHACHAPCKTLLAAARAERQTALAARDRHRARDARLRRQDAERNAARVPKVSQAQAPALPAAAADVLARALAKAKIPR
ncbi:MAG: hypothetical protein M3Q51_01980 [Pseudomonadota bacterium]|nr:hypothetical protein [Pseudomonadota bacterium]